MKFLSNYYRSTPLANGNWHGQAELLMSPKLRTRIPIAPYNPQAAPPNTKEPQKEEKARLITNLNFDSHHTAKQLRVWQNNDYVWIKDSRLVVKHRLLAKFAGWIWGDHPLDFGSQSSRMKRKTNDSGVNYLLSWYRTYRRTEKNSIKRFPTTSCFRSSMISKAVQIKYRFDCLFPIFSFSSSLRQNFVFARLGSPALEALLKIGNQIS